MDNFNNNGILNTPNPTNDDSSNTRTDYNSMQPQSNTLGILPTDNTSGSAPVSGQAPVVDQSPDLDAFAIDALAANPDDINAQLGVKSSQEETTVTQSETPAEDTVPVVDVSGIPPVVDLSAPVEEVNVLPQIQETTIEQTTPIAPDLSTISQSMDQVTPTMEVQQAPDMMLTPIESNTSDVLSASVEPAPLVEETPVMASAPVMETVDSQSAFPTAESPMPEISKNLAQPTMEEIPSEEVVNTLSESKVEEKEGSVVIIVLVIIIVLLLAGVGYFGYQIFLG